VAYLHDPLPLPTQVVGQ